MSVQRCTWSTIRTFALAGALIAGFAACSDEPERDETTGEITESGDADVFTIQVGDCMSESATGEVQDVPVVPCDQPHESEVFHSYQVPGDTFPGDFESIVQEQCFPAFQAFVGLAYEQSALDITWLEPTSESWTQQNDRELLCMIFDPAGQTTGSLQGANR